MARALRLAERGRYSTHPNPRVGCVIVRKGEIVAEGFHERAGQAHAEVLALQAAGDKAKGAELYVTLEPCCHQGRTPPCTDALIRAGVKRVVAAMEDPNPKVSGQGLSTLRLAGVETDVGLMEEEAEALNRGFVSRMARGRPWVTLKLAMSLDGRTAMASGESRWITGEEARADVHRLRAEAGAVLTSVNTVLADDPELTVRSFFTPSPLWRGEGGGEGRGTPPLPPHPNPLPLAGGEGMKFVRQPERIVLDTQLRSPPSSKVWKPDARRIALSVRPPADRMEALRKAGVEVALAGTTKDGRVDLTSALATLGQMAINEVLVESGSILAGAFLQSGLVDELVIYTAPSLLGDEARALAHLPGLSALNQRLSYRFTDVRLLGSDLRLTLRPEAA